MAPATVFPAALGGVGVEGYIAVSVGLFAVGLLGVVRNRRSIVVTLASVEVMLLAATLNLAAFSMGRADPSGYALLLGVLAVAVAQMALAVAIVIALQRNRGSIDVADMNLLRD